MDTGPEDQGVTDELAALFDAGGALQAVSEVRYEGDPAFVTAFCLQFETTLATILAEPDYDTVQIVLGPWAPGPDETVVDVSAQAPWRQAIGCGLAWGWELTNHQGYVDGVRLELGDARAPALIEMVVMASALHLFQPRRCPPGQAASRID